MAERYVPTAEEIASAEATMSPKQAALSEKREYLTGILRQLGVEGFLTTSAHTGTGEHIAMGYYDTSYRYIRGSLNGHKILLYASSNDPDIGNKWSAKIEGRIDGKLMSNQDARATWQKYAVLGCTITDDEIENARKELKEWSPLDSEKEAAHEALKDIL